MKKDDSREDVLPPNVDGVKKRSEQKKNCWAVGGFGRAVRGKWA